MVHTFDDLSATMRAALPALGVSQIVVVVVVILAALELVVLMDGGRRSADWATGRDALTALGLGLGGLVVGAVAAGFFVAAYAHLGALAPGAVRSWWDEHRLLGWISAFVAWDLATYVYHRIGHATPLGWAAHRPHHTGSTFDLTLAWRQSWLPVHGVVLPFVALGGWPLGTIVVCAAVSNLWQALQHTALTRSPPRWMTAVVMTHEQHRHHHLDRDDLVNLGAVLTVWDRMAGTHVVGPVTAGSRFGTGGTPSDRLWRGQFDGWVRLVTTRRDRVV